MDNELAAIGERLKAIEEVLTEHIGAIRSAQERHEKLEASPKIVRAEIAFDDASKRENKAEADRQHSTQHSISRTAWYAFVAAFLLASASYLQLNEMRTQTAQVFRQSEIENASASRRTAEVFEQLRIAQEQAKAAQDSVKAIQRQTQGAERAWITIEMPQPTITTIAENQPITGQIRFTNSGQSMARKIWAEAVIEVVKNGMNPKFDYTSDHNQALTGLLLKNETMDLTASRYVHQRSKPGSNAVLLPLSHDEFQEYLVGKSYIAVYARVRYQAFGIHHWTTRCAYFAQKPPPGVTWFFTAYKCTNYGDVDDN